MFKKALALFGLLTSMSFAAWDYLPILPKGMGQAVAQFQYSSMDPLSSVDLVAGIRFSAFNWLELSAILPYRVTTSFDGDNEYIEEKVDKMNGIGNITLGLRFQFTETFSVYADAYLPGEETYTESDFFFGVGLQHSSIYTHLIWASDIGLIYGDPWTNQFLKFGTELNVLLGPFVPYAHLDFFYGLESDAPDNGFGYSSDDEGGGNGLLVGPGLKFAFTPQLSVDLSLGFYMGDRFSTEEIDSPTVFAVGIYFTF
jgi:hypothetical protein